MVRESCMHSDLQSIDLSTVLGKGVAKRHAKTTLEVFTMIRKVRDEIQGDLNFKN